MKLELVFIGAAALAGLAALSVRPHTGPDASLHIDTYDVLYAKVCF